MSDDRTTAAPPREYVIPTHLDFLRGRGGINNTRQAHQRLLKIIRKLEPEYQKLKRGENGKYAMGLRVANLFHGEGGRFLGREKDSNGNMRYFEMDEQSTVKLIQQKFRDTPETKNNSQRPMEIAESFQYDPSQSNVVSIDGSRSEDDNMSWSTATAPVPISEHSLSGFGPPSHPHYNNMSQVLSSDDSHSWNTEVEQAAVTVPITPTTSLLSDDLQWQPSEERRLLGSVIWTHPANNMSRIDTSSSERDELERHILASLPDTETNQWMHADFISEPMQAHFDAVLPQHLREIAGSPGSMSDDLDLSRLFRDDSISQDIDFSTIFN